MQLKDYANGYCRLFTHMKKPQTLRPSIFDGLPGGLRDLAETAFSIMKTLRKEVLTHLKNTQQAG